MSEKYWHVVYEVSGKPPVLPYGESAHKLDIGFSSKAESFPIEDARISIEDLYRDTELIRHHFMLTAIVSWTEIDQSQFVTMAAHNNTTNTKQMLQEKECKQTAAEIPNLKSGLNAISFILGFAICIILFISVIKIGEFTIERHHVPSWSESLDRG